MTAEGAVAASVVQNGPVTCELAAYGGFVLVRVPVKLADEEESITIVSRYSHDTFLGRETEWPLSGGQESALTLRIPAEQFRDGELLHIDLRRAGKTSSRPLWSGRYEMRWERDVPTLQTA